MRKKMCIKTLPDVLDDAVDQLSDLWQIAVFGETRNARSAVLCDFYWNAKVTGTPKWGKVFGGPSGRRNLVKLHRQCFNHEDPRGRQLRASPLQVNHFVTENATPRGSCYVLLWIQPICGAHS
jgi:hypothetical protein